MTRKTRIFLTVSVVLNVVLLGIICGHCYRMWQEHLWHEVREELAPESQRFVATTFQAAFHDIRAVGDEARKIRADLVKILSAETFDEKAFDRQIKKLAVTRNKIAAIKIKATKDVVMKLSQEERAKMADGMAKMVGGGWEKPVRCERTPEPMGRADGRSSSGPGDSD